MNEKKLSILLVEDSTTGAMLIKDMLSDEYDIRVAVHAGDAYRLLHQKLPDFILLDLMLPDIDGFSILETLKSNKETASIPVIVVSALDDRATINRAMGLGAEDYITKPIRPRQLQEHLHKIEKTWRKNLHQ